MPNNLDAIESVLKRMEPDVALVGHRLEECAVMSIAISLKRIADALTEPANNYGETILPALARAISDGINGR